MFLVIIPHNFHTYFTICVLITILLTVSALWTVFMPLFLFMFSLPNRARNVIHSYDLFQKEYLTSYLSNTVSCVCKDTPIVVTFTVVLPYKGGSRLYNIVSCMSLILEYLIGARIRPIKVKKDKKRKTSVNSWVFTFRISETQFSSSRVCYFISRIHAGQIYNDTYTGCTYSTSQIFEFSFSSKYLLEYFHYLPVSSNLAKYFDGIDFIWTCNVALGVGNSFFWQKSRAAFFGLPII